MRAKNTWNGATGEKVECRECGKVFKRRRINEAICSDVCRGQRATRLNKIYTKRYYDKKAGKVVKHRAPATQRPRRLSLAARFIQWLGKL